MSLYSDLTSGFIGRDIMESGGQEGLFYFSASNQGKTIQKAVIVGESVHDVLVLKKAELAFAVKVRIDTGQPTLVRILKNLKVELLHGIGVYYNESPSR